MKKHLSVLTLLQRTSIYKILLLFAAMAATELLFFHRLLMEYLSVEETILYDFNNLVRKSHISLVFLLAFVILTIILSINGCEWKNKTSYTIRRLSISEQNIFLLQALHNSFCYILFVAMQLVIVILMLTIFKNTPAISVYTNQTLFLALYDNEFLHSLLPLEEGSRWIRNLFLILALGLTSAYIPFSQRRKKRSFAIIVLSFITILLFPAPIGYLHMDLLLIFISIFSIGWILYSVFRKEVSYEH